MKLAVSNLCYPKDVTKAHLKALFSAGVRGIEVAPTRISPWDALTVPRLTDYRTAIEDCGLKISSLQAIFFGLDGLALLGNEESFLRMQRQVARVGAICEVLGGRVMVFGAPGQRSRGNLHLEAAFDLGAERFSRLAEISARHGVTIGLEPVPAHYKNDFLQDWRSVLRMVRAVSSPGLSVHLDTGCVYLGEENIGEAVRSVGDGIAHVQISEPNLGDFSAPVARHAQAAAALHEISYANWISIEMLEQQPDPFKAVYTAVGYVLATYGQTRGLQTY
jgi:sugar phosphate isomerase/epimerase